MKRCSDRAEKKRGYIAVDQGSRLNHHWDPMNNTDGESSPPQQLQKKDSPAS